MHQNSLGNPIAVREFRLYKRAIPSWIRHGETIGIITLSLVLCAYVIIHWLLNRSAIPLTYIYHWVSMEVIELVQVITAISYGFALMRFTAAGVSVANRYQRSTRDDILITGISVNQVIWGQWYAAMYRVRGWMIALGLVRITAIVIMAVDFQFSLNWNHLYFNQPNIVAYNYGFYPFQFPLAMCFCIVLTIVEVWATTGIGILTGSWLLNSGMAWVTASGLRALPIIIFSWFPTGKSPGPSYDFLVLRWYEYTWFAFADGGTGAMLRLILPVYFPYQGHRIFFERSLLAFLAAFHMLLFFGGLAYFVSHLQWRGWQRIFIGKIANQTQNKNLLNRSAKCESLVIITVALAFCMMLVFMWGSIPRATPQFRDIFYYNPVFLSSLYSILCIAIGIATLRAIIAGVRQGNFYKDKYYIKYISINKILRFGLTTCNQLRGWFLGLAVILMTGFGLLIAEHLTTFYNAQLYDCALATYKFVCGSTYFGWQPTQWLFGLVMAIVLSGSILFSSVVIGIGARIIFCSPIFAFIAAASVRVGIILLGLLPPNAQIFDRINPILLMHWRQHPIIIFADTGISALFGMAEPFWHTGHASGLTNIAYGLLAFTLVMYMLLGYTFSSIVTIQYIKPFLDRELPTKIRSR